jgi:hypothetical protein
MLLAAALSAVPSPPSRYRLVVNNDRPPRQPICLFGTDLTLIRCFGHFTAPERNGAAGQERLIAPGNHATIWAGAQQYQYMIERYEMARRLIARIGRDAAWLPASRREDRAGGSLRLSRPLPCLGGLRADRGGRIRTAVLVPDQHLACDSAGAAGRSRGSARSHGSGFRVGSVFRHDRRGD